MMQLPNPLIYLASASPRRSALLTQIGVTHQVRPVDIDEGVRAAEPPGQYVERLAAHKAQTLWRRLAAGERRPVLGADTTVAIDGAILGKPLDRADGVRMLQLLSGRTHQVFTSVALCWAGGCRARLSVSEVTFRKLDGAEPDAYWESGEPAGKAGGYAIQGLAALFIERIAGSYSGIMGLPLYETGALLEPLGWSAAGAMAPPALREGRG